ncbi:maleylpyruvate isomerase N-terminal domain-containing protein [Lentzea albida]|uniref:TIGR03083 family protein n=1 Tax=Lentzea albida TaxID=65499 RepID=A0A1H9TXI0_9PSEU|nr:maleylpyruvate isomerase N-terminal domain-containing protein [Lentzea albida]SES01721.1 TIGR03083 family protein [Lentzea albida]
MPVTADDLEVAVSCLADALAPATTRDWTTRPGTGEWNARQTAEHLGDCLLSYAAQLVARPAGRYVRFLAVADEKASPAEVLEFAVAGGRILASVVRTTEPSARAYHPTGVAGPAHFAGMGCVEVLVHGEDIARGLGLALDPPRDVCARVLAAMFPHDDLDVDPWTGLLWATDRVSLPGRESQTGWRWQGPPE